MAQRITTNMMSTNFLRNLNNSMNKMYKLQNQMITGRKYEKFSDNPIATMYGLQARARLARVEQYRNNCADAQTWLDKTENCLTSLNETVKEINERVIDLSTDGKTPEDRALVAQVVKQFRDNLLTTLNDTLSDKYVFGGYNTTTPPYAIDEQTGILCYKGVPMYSNDPAVDVTDDFKDIKDEKIRFEIGFSTYMDVNVNGVNAVGINDQNLYKIMDDLYKTLTETETVFVDPEDAWQGSEDAPVSRAVDVTPFIKPLQQSQSRVLMILGDLGGKTNRLDMMRSRYDLDEYNYTALQSHYEDKDEAEAITEFNMAKLAYEAALQAGAKIIPLSLTNFLG